MGNFYATNICTKIVYLCRILEQLGPNYIRNKRHIYSKVLCALSLFAQFSLNKSNFSLVTLFRSNSVVLIFRQSVVCAERTNLYLLCWPLPSMMTPVTGDYTSRSIAFFPLTHKHPHISWLQRQMKLKYWRKMFVAFSHNILLGSYNLVCRTLHGCHVGRLCVCARAFLPLSSLHFYGSE